MRYMALLSYYDAYNEVDESNLGLYQILAQKSEYIGVGIYNIVLTAGVYASGVAIIVSALLLMYANKGNSTKLAEAKQGIVRTLLISIAIFCISGLIALVQNMALY